MQIDVAGVQRRLTAARLDPGAADGRAGPRTYAALLAYIAGAGAPNQRMIDLGAACSRWLAPADVDVSSQRLGNFLGQCCHESGGWRYLREIWGPTPAQAKYEGRADLGNTQPGDGKRFMGRGLIQLTGRHNYEAAGDALGIDLTRSPELAETPEIAVRTATWFWNRRSLNALADEGCEDTITARINGGTNGRDRRRRLVARARAILEG